LRIIYVAESSPQQNDESVSGGSDGEGLSDAGDVSALVQQIRRETAGK
jgi:hypothetical protein